MADRLIVAGVPGVQLTVYSLWTVYVSHEAKASCRATGSHPIETCGCYVKFDGAWYDARGHA